MLMTGADSEHAGSRRSKIGEGIPTLRKPYTDKKLCDTVRSLLNGKKQRVDC